MRVRGLEGSLVLVNFLDPAWFRGHSLLGKPKPLLEVIGRIAGSDEDGFEVRSLDFADADDGPHEDRAPCFEGQYIPWSCVTLLATLRVKC